MARSHAATSAARANQPCRPCSLNSGTGTRPARAAARNASGLEKPSAVRRGRPQRSGEATPAPCRADSFSDCPHAGSLRFKFTPNTRSCRYLREATTQPRIHRETGNPTFFRSARSQHDLASGGELSLFAGSWHTELDQAVGLRLQWAPGIKRFFDVAEAKQVVARFRARTLGLEIARLYPQDSPWKVEKLLIEEGLMPALEPPRLLERMVQRGMPMLPGSPIAERSIRRFLGQVLRLNTGWRALLDDPIFRLLDPSPVSAALLADFAARAIQSGAPDLLLCRHDNQLGEADRYHCLLRIALIPGLGRQLALFCALIELRHAELRGDLPAYETCLRAIPDIASTRADGSLYEALTGVPCGGSRSGKVGPWLLNDGLEEKLMHVSDYVAATFSRVLLSKLAISCADEFDRDLRRRGLELDGPPRFAWRGGPTSIWFER
jgi:hypothetical protein